MSYILDALRRADADRERGAVPGLHARQMPQASEDDAPAPSAGLRWGLAAAAVVIVAGAAWWWLGRTPPVVAVLSPPPAAAPTAPEPAAAGQTPGPAQPTLPAATVPAPVAVTPTAPAVVAVSPPLARAPARAPAAAVQKPTPAPAPTTAARPTQPASAAAESRLYAQNELPDEIRRELPNLAIGGSIYSKTPSARLLIVSGQLFHEGDTLAPNLTLEQIDLKFAVLRYKGYRYGVNY